MRPGPIVACTVSLGLMFAGPGQGRCQLAAPGVGAAISPAAAMAWGVAITGSLKSMDLDSAQPELRGCLSSLRGLDFTDPNGMEVLFPVVSRLADSGVQPRDFAMLDPVGKEQALTRAITQVMVEKRFAAAGFISRGADEVHAEDLDAYMDEAGELERFGAFLREDQRVEIGKIHERLSGRGTLPNEDETLALAEDTAARLAGETAVEKKEVPALIDTGPLAPEKVLRTVIAPDGRTARFINQGTVYRVIVEGEDEPVVEYDIADSVPEFNAYNVLRDGHRGVYVNGRVWWEDGEGPS